MKKTVQQIREEHSARSAAILSRYFEATDEIRAVRKIEEGPYSDRLTDEQRMTILREGKRERADEAYRRAREDYAAELDRYQEEVRARTGYIKGRLFGMSGPDSAATIARAALASEEELGTMLELGADAGNEEVARAALLAAERRGFAGLVVRVLEVAGDEARGLYAEWSDRPPEEMLARQREGVDAIVAPPDYGRLEASPLPNY